MHGHGFATLREKSARYASTQAYVLLPLTVYILSCRLIWKYETSKEARIVSYIDRIYTCRDCGQEFVFTAGEQEFYSQKGFLNDPVRCPDCRRARKKARQESGPRKRDTHAPDRHREH
jgi:ssDNA-binding Zn-finger/Zn-ribbon topoisomerase 1